MSEPREIVNATITEAWIGREDHGIMTCYVMLDYGGSCQGFGGYALDTWSERLRRRIGTAYGMEWVMNLLTTFEVDRFDKLMGMPIRAEREHTKVHRIGHYLKDQWFDPTTIKNEAL